MCTLILGLDLLPPRGELFPVELAAELLPVAVDCSEKVPEKKRILTMGD